MAPPTPIFNKDSTKYRELFGIPPTDSDKELNETLAHSDNAKPIINISKCPLKALTQYECGLRDDDIIECLPLKRFFRVCKDPRRGENSSPRFFEVTNEYSNIESTFLPPPSTVSGIKIIEMK